jgi:hypothetical protein
MFPKSTVLRLAPARGATTFHASSAPQNVVAGTCSINRIADTADSPPGCRAQTLRAPGRSGAIAARLLPLPG